MRVDRAAFRRIASPLLVTMVAALAASGAVVAQAPTVGDDAPCGDCVEDVVVETRNGQFVAGYIYWRTPPFRYLDLEAARSRAALRANGYNRRLRLWPHAVSISRDRLPASFGEPPPAPSAATKARMGALSRADEIALLVGEPVELATDSVRRIYPRIGSGWPALEITQRQLLKLVQSDLPLHAGRGSECLGCPTTVEDATIVLRSGGLVSGLLAWHQSNSPLPGYDLQAPDERKAFRDASYPPSGKVVLWPGAVSGPRRRFKGNTASGAGGAPYEGFFRLGRTALLMEDPFVYTLDEVSYVLPGPSRQASALPIDLESALRLLHEQPLEALARYQDSVSIFCFSYDPAVRLTELARRCRAESTLFRQFWDEKALPPEGILGLLSSPGVPRRVTAPDGGARVIAIYYDHGT